LYFDFFPSPHNFKKNTKTIQTTFASSSGIECLLLAVLELTPLPQKVITTPDRGGELKVDAEVRVSSAGHQV